MAIYDEPLHFMVIFWGPLLIPPCKTILEEYPCHWDALVRPICKKPRYICPSEGKNGPIKVIMAIYDELLHFMVIF